MKGKELALGKAWIVGDRIGGGGFGEVYAVTAGADEAAAKFVPKDPGADRELLFVDLEGIRNVVPIIDSGEADDHWVLVMPRADKSLRQHLEEARPGHLVLDEVVSILGDVATALVDLDGKVVHRDLKPENVLLVDGRWCLADFGISRYAEATTAPDTQKFALSPPYAAPERWRSERATGATDVYSLGVIAYELLAGSRPFLGPGVEDYREQHLHAEPPALEGVPTAFAALVDECMYKAPGARPSPANLAHRASRVVSERPSEGLARLQQADREEVSRRAESARRESESRSAEDTRYALFDSAGRALTRISDALRDAILAVAPSAKQEHAGGDGWALKVGEATLSFSSPARTPSNPWQWQAPALDVVAHATLSLRIPADRYQYEGRSHSLWFCDAQAEGEFAWYEVAFMVSPFIARRGRQDPFALDPGEESAKALWAGMAEFQVAWPFTRLAVEDLDEFIDRWAGWLADAADGRFSRPSTMPDRDPTGSWRRN